jgi:hypothetical protein
MNWLINFLNFTHYEIETPKAYGLFHLGFLIIGLAIVITLAIVLRRGGNKQHKIVFLSVSILLIIIETYKQLYFTYVLYDSYAWYAFPLQMCSMPIYLCLILAFLKEGKIKRGIAGFVGLYSFLSGLLVVFIPGDCFMSNLSISIHTMVWHLTITFVGLYCLTTGLTGKKLKDLIPAFITFLIVIGFIVIVDIVGYNLLNPEGVTSITTFNMFFISPYYTTSLPVLPAIQEISYVLFLSCYIFAFTLGATLVLLSSIGLRKLFSKKTKKQLN